MKRTVLFTALFSSLILAGCQGEDVAGDTNEQADTTEQASAADTSQGASTVDSSNETDKAASKEEEPEAYTYEVNPANFTIQPIEEGEETQVALLTFDDAPDGNAVRIAETLEEHDASAIFFVNGMYLESDEGKEDLKTIHEMGYEIGNHTHTHPVLSQISEEKQREEIVKTNDLVEEIIGIRPRFFRAPHGVNTDYSHQVAEEEGMVLMNWTYGYDWEPEYQDADALADIMVNTPLLNNGANLLMHDRTWTSEAVPDIITGLRDKGYTLVDPGQLYSPEREGEPE